MLLLQMKKYDESYLTQVINYEVMNCVRYPLMWCDVIQWEVHNIIYVVFLLIMLNLYLIMGKQLDKSILWTDFHIAGLDSKNVSVMKNKKGGDCPIIKKRDVTILCNAWFSDSGPTNKTAIKEVLGTTRDIWIETVQLIIVLYRC